MSGKGVVVQKQDQIFICEEGRTNKILKKPLKTGLFKLV